MNKAEFQTYHEHEAARLRRLIASATTPALKAWLIEQAQEHERLADGLTVVRQSKHDIERAAE
jgi:hypothetical protein